MSRFSTIAFSIFIVFGLFISPRTTMAAEPNACPVTWPQGHFRYSSTTEKSSTVVFDKIDENSIHGSWTEDSGVTGTEVAGWHAASGKVVIAGYESDGDYWKIEAPDVSETGFSGQAVFGKKDGTENRGNFKFTWKSDDLAVTHFDGKDLEGNNVTFDGRFERIDRTSTREESHDFVDQMVGRWSGEITLIADWPGLKKKKGEKLVRYVTRNRIADGEGFYTSAVGGVATDVDISHFDAAAQQILIAGTSSAGHSFRAIIWKESQNEWGWTSTGSLSDGSKTVGHGSLTFSDHGNTYTLKGRVMIDGQETDPLHNIFTRLN